MQECKNEKHSFINDICEDCGLDMLDFFVSNGTITVEERVFMRQGKLEKWVGIERSMEYRDKELRMAGILE